MSKSNRGIFVIGAVVTAIGLALYPVAVHPKLFPQNYRKYFRNGELNDLTGSPPHCLLSGEVIW
jgi:xanthine/uracil permease